MKLEIAVKLKKGTRLRAAKSFSSSTKVTKGEIYIMNGDAEPLESGVDNRVFNVYLPIKDDLGRDVRPMYHFFEVA